MWAQQVFRGRRTLQWEPLEVAAVPPSAAAPVPHPEADAATAAIVQAFLSGSTAGCRPSPDAQAVAESGAPELAPIDASTGVSSAAAPDAVHTAAAQRAAPVRSDVGSVQADFPSRSPLYAGIWTKGTAELVAVPAPAAAPSLAVGDVADDEAAAESACAGLQGNPSDWLISGGALGYQCAMQVRAIQRFESRQSGMCSVRNNKTNANQCLLRLAIALPCKSH